MCVYGTTGWELIDPKNARWNPEINDSLRYFRQQPIGRSIYFLKIIWCNPKKFPLVHPNFVSFARVPKHSPLIHLSMKPAQFPSVFCKRIHIRTTNSFVGFVIGPEPPAAVSRTDLTQFRTALVHFHFLLHDGKSRDYADLRKCNCIIKLIRLSMTAVFKRLSTWLLGKASKRNENTMHGSQDTQMTSRVFHVSWHYYFRVIYCISFDRKHDYTPMCTSAWRISYFVQSQNTTKHKIKFITLWQHVSA